MVTVNFVKKELSDESALPADVPQYDFDHYGATLPPAPGLFEVRRQPPQVPWWQPKIAPAPGPQEEYESEFQVPPPFWWPTIPTIVVKSPNCIAPTALDEWIWGLYRYGKDDQIRNIVRQQGSAEVNWNPPPGWENWVGAKNQQQWNILERQKKAQLEMKDQSPEPVSPVCGCDWKPPPGWEESLLPDYQQALKYLRETDKTKLTMAKQKEPPIESIDPHPKPALPNCNGSHGAQGDYHMQLMLLEQQNKRRLMLARQVQDRMTPPIPLPIFTQETTPSNREQSVDSVWSTQFTPESTPGFPEGAGIQVKFELDPDPPLSDLRSRSLQQQSCQCHDSGSALQCYKCQMKILEEQNRVAREELKKNPLGIESQFAAMRTSHSLQDYQARMMALEQQNKNRLMAERQKDYHETLSMPAYNDGRKLQDYQMQLMLLEQQNKRRLICQGQNYYQETTFMPTPNDNHQLQDYEMQLMLLEQQNKKRLMMARQEQEFLASNNAASTTTQDWETEQEDNGPVCMEGGSRADILHSRPLVIRERPTCDD